MIEETTSQLLEGRNAQASMVDTIQGKGHDLEQLTSRCSDLEERLKEEVERKDFLALELHKAEGGVLCFRYIVSSIGNILETRWYVNWNIYLE